MNNDDVLKKLEEGSNSFVDAMKEIENEQEEYWKSLTKDQQLMAFCAVSRRIYKGEIEDRRSYRGVLYDTFEFGLEAYASAQMAGYLSIHNAIYDSMEMRETLLDFCKQNNVEDAENKVDEFTLRMYY